jgi:DNA-directed RNA polymerase
MPRILQMVVLEAAAEGIEMLVVHDSFGTIAPRMGRLNQIIREQFQLLHETHDPLAAVLQQAKRDLPKSV